MNLYRLTYSYEETEDDGDSLIIYSGVQSCFVFADSVAKARKIAATDDTPENERWYKATVEEFPVVEGIVDI